MVRCTEFLDKKKWKQGTRDSKNLTIETLMEHLSVYTNVMLMPIQQ
jgi:hypothetical protein